MKVQIRVPLVGASEIRVQIWVPPSDCFRYESAKQVQLLYKSKKGAKICKQKVAGANCNKSAKRVKLRCKRLAAIFKKCKLGCKLEFHLRV